MRRTPLSRKPSPKRRKENAVRARLTREARRDGPVLCVRCGRLADDLHEIKTRARGGSITDPANLAPLCREDHTWVTEHPLEAHAEGLVKHSWE